MDFPCADKKNVLILLYRAGTAISTAIEPRLCIKKLCGYKEKPIRSTYIGFNGRRQTNLPRFPFCLAKRKTGQNNSRAL